MTTSDIFRKAYLQIRDNTFRGSRASWVNGMEICEVVRTRRTTDAMLDMATGRVDPSKFEVRGLVDQVGDVIVGRSVTVDGEECNIDQINPDSIGVTVTMILRKRNLS